MKNLQQLTADLNLFTVENIPLRYKTDSYDHRIKIGNRDIPEYLKAYKGIEIGLFYECKQDTDYQGKISYYIDHSYVILKSTGNDILIMLRQDRNNKYTLHPYYSHLHKYQNISYHLREEKLKGLKEPNLIGVFSDKKVNDWLIYCAEYIRLMDELYNEVNGKNEAIEEKIKSFIQSIPGCKVSTYHNKTDIDTKYFCIRFEHFKDQNYLSTKIEFKGKLEDITKIETTLNTVLQ